MHAMMLSDTESESLYVEENRFDSWDDTAVFYRYWHGSPGLEGASVVLLHDHQEHSEYYRQLGGILAAAGYRVFAWDARGSGRSTADARRSPEFHDLVRDLEAFAAHLRREHQVDRSNMVVLGQGLGAALLCTWLHDYAPQIAGAVISSAPFRIPSQGVLRQQLLEWVARWRPGAETRPYFKLHEITADRGEAALRRDDPFVRPSLSVRLLLGQQQAMDRVLYRPESIELPLLMLSSDPEDSDVDRACGDFFERLGSIQKTWKRFESSGRALFHDGARAAAAELVKTFLGETLEGRRDRSQLFVSNAFSAARTLDGAASLSPGERFTRLHRLSRGARLARDTGMHSGHHTDYVLRNRPQGRSRLTRRVDRWYLAQGRCAALRERYRLLRDLIDSGLERGAGTSAGLRVLQLGGAPARGLIERMRDTPERIADAVCVDTDRTSLEAGRRHAGMLGLRNLRFAHAEIRDPGLIAEWPWGLDLIIADGALERCRDHAQVLRLLRALNGALKPQGRLIVGNMLPHPLTAGEPQADRNAWFRRDPAELNRLVRLVGFEPLRTEVEPSGIYSLSLLGRRGQANRVLAEQLGQPA